MAIEGMSVEGQDSDNRFNGKITFAVVITSIVAASGGLIFGFDIGISGGVTTMKPFLEKFFPSILKKAALSGAETNVYCVYDSEVLTAFTSSLYIAGLVASLVAGRLTEAIGRRNIMVVGGCTFFAGAAMNGAAQNISMLILGRILLGFGVGFTNQATPVYLSEMAPSKWRGAFSTGFQFFIGLGVVTANCINYATSKLSWGWRLSLGLAVVPAATMTIDTPSSLVERGKLEQAKQSLAKVRGTNNNTEIEAELADLIKSCEIARASKEEPFVTIFKRQHRPHLVMSIAIPFFQQMTGINIIAFYAPVLFRSVGFGNNSALLGAVILGLVNLGSILVSTGIVDRFGRRFLFILGGVQMLFCQVAIASTLAASIGENGSKHITKQYAALVLALMCIYGAGFGWSWGPLSWLIPSEIFAINIRSTGQSISVAMNFATTFVLSQTFLAMLCHFKYGAFLFFAGWIAVMTIFIVMFMPETKGVALNSMHQVWERHWFWGRYVKDQS
ncbi:sugar transport protein 5-like isoform X2 [Nicotiana tabacum]|uniref:Sugar transport protein 5-like isoform X2 n=2 Tax=Nicotiana TaxID=4085 RepID=A0A1S3YZ13_TOBAC|nr:PREDICTED: sugar transport protein 5 isoform X2 [Nicotiana sylvestris]XP_016457325.1 PREDICTED: sugar transport protein 5-like isoform X2 [Nicotiana tabacum]